MPRVLIVYYSRTGTTRKVAQSLKMACDADIDEIRDARPRKGLFRGWIRSLREVRRKKETRILPTAKRVENYDLVVLGTPTWAGCMSSPLRTWLNRNGRGIKRLAVFATQGGRGGDKAIQQVAELCGTVPVATLVINERDVDKEAGRQQLDDFAARLNRSEAEPTTVAATPEAA